MAQGIQFGFKALVFIAKIVFQFLRFTGIWLFFLLLWIITKIQHSNLQNSQILYNLVQWPLLIAMLIVPLYILVNNIIRTVKSDPHFSLFSFLFLNKEKKAEIGTGTKGMKNFSPRGFIFGKKKNLYVSKLENEDGHISVMGGAGSGKSSCIAIPSLVSWRSTVFAIDIKGELSQKTTQLREKKGHTVCILDPIDDFSYGFDPFYLLKNSKNHIQDIKEITQSIVPAKPDDKDPFWQESAQNVLSSVLLFGFENGFSFTQSIELFQSHSLPVLFQLFDEKASQNVKFFINQLKDLKPETLSNIGQTLSNKIMVFVTDKDIISTLNRTKTLSPQNLENGEDVYIKVAEDKLEQWQSFLNIIVNSFLKSFERRNELILKEKPNPILFLLDEFPRLGKIPTITNGLSTLRSKQITIALFMQSMAQLDLIYGKETRQVIFDNCQYKAILKATDQDTQEYLSKLVGTYDKTKNSQNANFGAIVPTKKGIGTSKTTEEKRIIKSEDFGTLQDIVLLTPNGFERVNKCPYYQDINFK